MTAEELQAHDPEAYATLVAAVEADFWESPRGRALQAKAERAERQGFREGRQEAMAILSMHAPGLESLRAELAADPRVRREEAAQRILLALEERSKAQGRAFIQDRLQGEQGARMPGATSVTEMSEADAVVARALDAERNFENS